MGWLRKRLKERSTLNGAAIAAALLSIYVGPESAQAIVYGLAGAYAAYEAGRSEKKSISN
ncbi:MAG: hypothetical protein JKY86_07630 [Gammaproteobacteria bacterium]|nr:hypothetical protein [Gammaproteobacteria bacterium]